MEFLGLCILVLRRYMHYFVFCVHLSRGLEYCFESLSFPRTRSPSGTTNKAVAARRWRAPARRTRLAFVGPCIFVVAWCFGYRADCDGEGQMRIYRESGGWGSRGGYGRFIG